jgi:hypothetical protein
MINFVKISEIDFDDFGRRIIKFLRLGKDDVQTAEEASPFGIDSSPLKDMVAIYAKTGARGDTTIVGYLNRNKIADLGETRIYSTASDDESDVKMYIHLKNDGTAEFGGTDDNLTRFNKLKEGFDELKTDFNNFITTFNTHQHPETGATTGPPATPGQSSSASIDDAKIEEFKCL